MKSRLEEKQRKLDNLAIERSKEGSKLCLARQEHEKQRLLELHNKHISFMSQLSEERKKVANDAMITRQKEEEAKKNSLQVARQRALDEQRQRAEIESFNKELAAKKRKEAIEQAAKEKQERIAKARREKEEKAAARRSQAVADAKTGVVSNKCVDTGSVDREEDEEVGSGDGFATRGIGNLFAPRRDATGGNTGAGTDTATASADGTAITAPTPSANASKPLSSLPPPLPLLYPKHSLPFARKGAAVFGAVVEKPVPRGMERLREEEQDRERRKEE
jgi:membrane protein involved in colicin uptake